LSGRRKNAPNSARWHDANVGIPTGATSGVVVLDVDPRHGGHQSLVMLVAKHSALPSTPTVLTGGGGRHYYFRTPRDVEIRNSIGALGPGLDIRGKGGYVIAPPSVHPNGQRYRWKSGSRIDEVELALLPDWLTTLLNSPPRPRASNRTVSRRTASSCVPATRLDLSQLAAGVSEGQRDWELFRLACHLCWRGYPREEAELIVLDAASWCRPPFPIDAALRKVDSAWRYVR
jgi:hypothetical protein